MTTQTPGVVRMFYRVDSITGPERDLIVKVTDVELIVANIQPGYASSWCAGRIAQHLGIQRARVILGHVEKVAP